MACTVLKCTIGREEQMNDLPRFEYRVMLLLAILILVLAHAA